MSGATWKVGQLARSTGLTVRTLHHYDSVGLLRPSARTPSGHRLYDEDDVSRLYRIVALRVAQVQAEMDAGTDPGTPKVQALARRWMELLEFYHGGDPGLRDSMYRMQADNSEMIQQQYGGPAPEQIDYIRRANAVAR